MPGPLPLSISHDRTSKEFALKIVDRESDRIKLVPLEDPFRELRFIYESSDILSDVVAEVVDGMTLVGIHDQRVKIREVLLCNHIRKRLEAVRAQIQVLQVPEVLEVRMEACKAICTDGKSLEVRELGDMLTCIKAAEEVVCI